VTLAYDGWGLFPLINWGRIGLKAMIPKRWLIRQLPWDGSKCVLLTFDDGPHPEITPAILDRLDSYQTRAVFFIVGHRIVRAPHLLKEIEKQGHIVGNHSYLHPRGHLNGFRNYRRDLIRCQDTIRAELGRRPLLYRPPGGRIRPIDLAATLSVGLRTMTWSLDPEDWRCRTENDAHRIADIMTTLLRARDIILLHDDNPCVLTLLDRILPFLKKEGYDLSTGLQNLAQSLGLSLFE
jgi:peptidoglycan/xylan/chitin deacetylase (PgdA/CDA1 family)